MAEKNKTLNELLEVEPIVDVFSNPANAKILTVLNDAGGRPLTVSDIVEQTDISKQAFYDNKDTLLKYNLIQEAGKSGNASQYTMELSSEVAQRFVEFRDVLIDKKP